MVSVLFDFIGSRKCEEETRAQQNHPGKQTGGSRRCSGPGHPPAEHYRRLRSARLNVGAFDLKIAAITLANEATLLSRNLKDFKRVPGLSVENWLD
ncbi:MAG: type II toxin-antitoxin system VapC family toxin [Planctomycetota bacterium]